MAKHTVVRPRHAPQRPSVTPLTRGASTSDFPYAIPAPTPSSAIAEEARLFSPPGATATSTGVIRSQGRGDHAAATARMRSVPLDDAELDALGEAEVVAPSDPDAERDDDDVVPATRLLTAEIERRVREDITKALRASQPLPPPPPPPTPTGVAPAVTVRPRPHGALVARTLVVEDTDRLWDWIRADAQTGIRFFGTVMQNSMALHHTMEALLRAEANGLGLIRSVYYEQEGLSGAHLGFVMLAPILSAEQIAIAHLYLRPDLRGRLSEFLPALLSLAAADLPGFKIAVLPADVTQSRLYRGLLLPLGFAEHVVFVK